VLLTNGAAHACPKVRDCLCLFADSAPADADTHVGAPVVAPHTANYEAREPISLRKFFP
jgi:hypothetical protein